ncbi:MAG: WD40 repeat domain-containing protein [Pirellulaceae bacterium]|nr:WD40 repeat domain-containing protein [Pirellulaceae bacterium]
MKSIRPGAAACVVMLMTTLLTGCSQPQNSAPASSADAPADVAVDVTNRPDQSGSLSGDDSQSTTQFAGTTEISGDNSTVSSVVDATVGGKNTLPDKQPTAPAAQQRPIPNPTQQQIAQWNLQAIEPLQLVDSVVYAEMGFTQRIVPLPNSRQYLLAGSTITLWTLGTERPEHQFVDWRQDEKTQLRDLSVSPDGSWFAATNSTGMLYVFDIPNRRELASKKVSSTLMPSISISTDGTSIATANYNSEVSVWNVEGLTEKNSFKLDSRGLKQLLFISPDKLVTAAEALDVWDAATGTKLQSLSSDRYLSSLSLSPDGQWFTHADSKGFQVRQTSDFATVARLLGQTGQDELVVWKDQQTLASVSGNLIRIWNIPTRSVSQAIDNRGSELASACWLAESKVLALASLLRHTRFWATATDAAALNLRPIQPEIAPPNQSASTPASTLQFSQIIDLRSFPRLPDAVPVLEMDYMTNYSTQVSLEEAALFCRYALHQAGWTEVASESASPGSMGFIKHGFRLECSVTEVPGTGTTVSLTSLGNCDVRQLPKPPPPIEVTYESIGTGIYRSPSNLLTLETALLKSMVAQGWIPYSRLSASHSEKADERTISFLNNSIELRVSIAKDFSDASKYTIQYSSFPVSNSIPLPKDCTYIEFNGSPELQLVASSRLSAAELTQFFDAALAAQGWVVQQHGRIIDKDHCWLPYFRDQKDVMIGLKNLTDGWQRITVGNLKSSGSFQLAAAPQQADPNEDRAGLEAADLPMIPTAQEIQYQPQEKIVSFKVPGLPLADLIQFYEEQLNSLGWTKQERSMVEQEFCYADFAKGTAKFTVRGNFQNGKAACNIQGDGLLWTKQLPGPKTAVSYETWLRSQGNIAQGKIATLEFLPQYEAEMLSLTQ